MICLVSLFQVVSSGTWKNISLHAKNMANPSAPSLLHPIDNDRYCIGAYNEAWSAGTPGILFISSKCRLSTARIVYGKYLLENNFSNYFLHSIDNIPGGYLAYAHLRMPVFAISTISMLYAKHMHPMSRLLSIYQI